MNAVRKDNTNIMATEWFDDDGSGIAINKEDPCMLIVGSYTPDWIRLPDNIGPPDGGRQLKVTSTKYRPCPTCKKEVRYLVLEDRWVVAQCKPGCGWLVCRERENG